MKKIINTIKNIFNKTKNKFLKIWKNDFKDILIPALILLITIVSIFIFGIVISIIIFVILNMAYFIPICIIRKKRKKKLKKVNTKNDKRTSSKKKTIKTKKKLKKWKIFLLILLSLFILGVIFVIAFFAYIVIKAPDFNESLLYVSNPTVILDKDGNEIAKLGSERRTKIDYDEIPEVLVDAIVATEDSRFFEHNGVDWARFIKASVLQLLGKNEAGGASTLTMQVSKNTYTSNEASGLEGIIRKFTDVYVSIFKIEKHYSKEQIFSFYVNSHYLGKNAYGVEQVSKNYFGKSAKDLNLSEAAMIAGLFQAPGRYDPYKNPEATEKRRQTVLKLMLRHGYIEKKEYEIAKKMTVDKIVIPQEESSYNTGEVSKYQSFIDTVIDDVKEKTGKNPYSTSMIIYTTLNTDFQDYINGIMNGETFDWENDSVQAGIAVINVNDGSIAAIGGGRNVNAIDTYNYATEIENQIGSTAKPLYDYGPAVEYNKWNPSQVIVDEPTTYSDGHSINNWDGDFEGFQTIRVSLRGSRNIPALKTFKQLDKSQVIEFVTNLGLTPEIYSCNEGYTRDKKKCINNENPDDVVEANKDTTLHEAHSIGGYNGESPLTMASAYAAFANNGVYTKPYTFTKIIYQDTDEEYTYNIESTQAMSPETAYIISDMLVTTAPQAVSRYYNINGIKYAAKTGTTNYDEKAMIAHGLPSNAVNDLWTIGFNTEYAIGVWYGYDNISNEHYNTLNSGQHTRLFQAVGKKVFTNPNEFVKPDGVIQVEIERECATPSLPSEYTPSDLRQTELFVKGYEPTTVSNRFSKLSDVTNLKASTTDGKVIISWSEVPIPETNTDAYIRQQFSNLFVNNYNLNLFVSNRLNYMGSLGYNIYLKDSSDNLQLLDFVDTNKYEKTFNVSGEYTFVIKTTYSTFKNNMSDGKTITVNVTAKSSEKPKDKDKDEDEIKDKDEDTKNEKAN